METVLRGKFITISAEIKKVEKSHTTDLRTHLKALEQKEADSSRRSKWQEIIKLRAEINKIETNKQTKKQDKGSIKQRAGSLRKSTQ